MGAAEGVGGGQGEPGQEEEKYAQRGLEVIWDRWGAAVDAAAGFGQRQALNNLFCCSPLLLQKRRACLPKGLQEQTLFVPVTVALLAASYVMAVCIPSIWVVISLVSRS